MVKSKETHFVSLFIDRSLAVYFDSFGSEYIPVEVLNRIRDKSITLNIFRYIMNESIMCIMIMNLLCVDLLQWIYYCIAFIEYMLAGKNIVRL